MANPPPTSRVTDLTLSRRGLLGAAGAGIAVFASGPGAIAVPLGPTQPTFLSATELKTLAAVVDRVVPGQPEDLAVGAVQTRVPQAIDGLLAAFSTSPPRIFAGGPFSDRGGSPVNHFANFLPLDPYEQKAWKLRIEGAPGSPGFQEVYQRGLRALAKSYPGFALQLGPVRDVILRTTTNKEIVPMRDLAIMHTLEFYFAAPEYGGNQAAGAWRAVGFDGDRQPRGYTRDEVENPDFALLPILNPPLDNLLGSLVGSLLGTLTATVSGLLSAVAPGASMSSAATAAAPALAMGSTESVAGLSARGDDQQAVREAMEELLRPLKDRNSPESQRLRSLHSRAAELVAQAREGAR